MVQSRESTVPQRTPTERLDAGQCPNGVTAMAKADLNPSLIRLSGKIGELSFRETKNGIVVANAPSRPRPPATEEQARSNAYLSAASKQWRELSHSERDGWDAYAAAHPELARSYGRRIISGSLAFNKAAWNRQAAGLPLPGAPPTLPPPPAPYGLTVEPSGSPHVLRLAVDHFIGQVADFRLLVRITPACPPGRKPYATGYRFACGIAPSSLPPLQISGSVYTLNEILFPLAPADRFGIQLSIVSTDGIPSGTLARTVEQA